MAVLRSLAAIRVSQVVLFIPVMFSGAPASYSQPGAVIGLYALVALWVVAIVVVVLRRAVYSARVALADVAVIAAATWAVGMLSAPGHAQGWTNWAVAPMIGAGMMVASFRSRAQTWFSIAMLACAYGSSVWSDVGQPDGLATLVGNLGSLVVFAFVARLVTRMLRETAARTDELAHEASMARQVEAATKARLEERTTQYRILHDTVLSTLSLIARGGLDHRTTEVQERCASEADFLRGMVNGSRDLMPTSLGTALATVGHEPAAFGLRVHQQFDNLPEGLPDSIVETLKNVAREGLNNVAKHAKVSEAWLSATGDDDGVVTLTIADSGVGFDPATVTAGIGITESLRGRVDDIGGRISIDSAPGAGTTVEVVWAP